MCWRPASDAAVIKFLHPKMVLETFSGTVALIDATGLMVTSMNTTFNLTKWINEDYMLLILWDFFISPPERNEEL
jgi:hypothetical protein